MTLDKAVNRLHWVAHRGDMTHHPENTFLALAFALKLGADAIEFDLQMNTDQDFVLIHDDNFQRTSAIDLSVFNAKTRDIRNISVHQPKKYGQSFFPCPVSLLEDAMPLLPMHPKARAFIEIKEESLRYWGLERVMDALFNKLKAYQSQIILISFDYEAITYTQTHSNFAHGWVIKKYDTEHQQKALTLMPDFLIANYQKINHIDQIWKSTWQWMLYDVQDLHTLQTLINHGIQWIETGDIDKMINATSSRNL